MLDRTARADVWKTAMLDSEWEKGQKGKILAAKNANMEHFWKPILKLAELYLAAHQAM
jgi:hypothetical protein